MKVVIILLVCSILEISTSVSVENVLSEKMGPKISVNFAKINVKKSDESSNRKVNEMVSAGFKEYIFLSDTNGKVIIIDADLYEEVISYNMVEIAGSVLAIVNDTFYNIDTRKGTITSTSLKSILKGPSLIVWKHVGSFPKDSNFIRGNPAVDGSKIYFVTCGGIVYSYDTTQRIVIKIGTVRELDYFANLAVVNNVLYIHKWGNFYSYDGTSINLITMPQKRYFAGLFQMGDDVCIVGGNYTDVYPDPVYCYNGFSEEWTVPNRINEFRRYPAVVSTGSKTFVFGGWAYFASKNISAYWRDSAEVLDHETNVWGFIPSPLTENQPYLQALAFTTE